MIRGVRTRSDEGFSLAELMVYIVMFGIVGTMVVVMMLNGYRTQLKVTDTTQNTGQTQTAIKAITRDVKFSASYRVSAGGSLLVTRTWGGSDYICTGWYYDGTLKVLRHATTAAQTSGATSTSASNWPIYVRGVTASTAFTDVSGGVRVRFSGNGADWGRSTQVDTTVNQRPQDDDGSAPCF